MTTHTHGCIHTLLIEGRDHTEEKLWTSFVRTYSSSHVVCLFFFPLQVLDSLFKVLLLQTGCIRCVPRN